MEQKNDFVGLPFYLFITFTLGIAAFLGINSLWQAGMALRTVLLSVTFAGHIGLYWAYIRWYVQPRAHQFFYGAQTGLILSVFLILRGTDVAATVIGTMIITMVGESLGFWGNTRRALYLSLFYAMLCIVLFYFLLEWEQLGGALVSLAVNGGFVVILLILFNQQLAERQKATELAEVLESTNAKLTAYAAKIEQLTLQNERQRMARELHDTLAQGVAGLALQLEAIKMHLGAGRAERAFTIVEQALVRARNTLAESRAAIDDLRAAPENLPEAIREKVERFMQATGIPCDLELSLEKSELPAETIAHALQVMNEALANVARHARATRVELKFVLQNNGLEVRVHDNGQGFDVNKDAGAGHYGLIGMRERARLTGGTLLVESRPQNGTTVCFTASTQPDKGNL